MTHTKGPWRIEHQVGNFYYVIPEGHTQHVATVSQWLQPTEANARLIAAAPALYAALKECITDQEATCLTHNGPLGEEYKRMRLHAITTLAYAALAAADGTEQP